MEIIQKNIVTLFVISLIVLFKVGSLQAQSERSLIRDGNNAYKENKFTDAEINYRKALEKNKELPQGVFNLGDALYKQERFKDAADQYRITTTKKTDATVKAQAYHNLGNTLLMEKNLQESIKAYKEALKLNPHDADTKYNLEYAKALLKKQEQQQQQKGDQKEDKKQKEDQQKNKQQEQNQEQQKQKEQQQSEQQKQQQQAQEKERQQRQAQQKKQQISKEDAERILQALKNEEQNVQKKIQKRVPARVHVEKDW